MKRTIWKYPLAITDTQNVMMPEGAEILSAQMQGDTLCLWALVNPDAPKLSSLMKCWGRRMRILGSGVRRVVRAIYQKCYRRARCVRCWGK